MMLDTLTTDDTAQTLTLLWNDGRQHVLPAAFLRAKARDAWTIRESLDHGEVAIAPGIAITALREIGNGVNIHFSDGHDKAIYPFPYLRELSEGFDK